MDSCRRPASARKGVCGRVDGTTLRGNGFEAMAMEMLCEFTGELVEAVEVGVELVAAVVRPDGPRSIFR